MARKFFFSATETHPMKKYATHLALVATSLLSAFNASCAAPPRQNPQYSQAVTPIRGAQWNKGDRVPSQYQSSRYTVTDWRHRNLPPPARGLRWVRNDSDQYVLTNRRGTISHVVRRGDHPDTHRWARGERVPFEYRGGSYVVTDWQERRLRRPYPGYHWVRVNNQFLMIVIATGIIERMILDGQ
jgi:Ni/Co efflux regulator RcnB